MSAIHPNQPDRRSSDPAPQMYPRQPLTDRAIRIASVTVLVVATALGALLLIFLGGPGDSTRLESIKTTAAVLVGTGGAAALWLNARRQQYTELAFQHQREIAHQNDEDARQRRITDLYSKAAEQLGHDKAPVRIAGLYALERVGELDASRQRTVLFVICAYLRLPFDGDGRSQEYEVRLTASSILRRRRLLAKRPEDYWGGVTLNLRNANLAGASLSNLDLRKIILSGADARDVPIIASNLTGADLSGANLAGADLERADLTGADLSGAILDGTNLSEARLNRTNLARATGLTENQLATAIGDRSVDLPEGLLMPASWNGHE